MTRGGNEPGVKYIAADHLGSTETITNENGAVVEKRSYDAFGARRNPIWGTPAGVLTSKTKQGFTGHDEEDEFGLVNMKGRLFDPHIGRFTTTDPVIADIFDGQTLNAFSYVGNNPLTLIDPTGFQQQTREAIPVILDTIEQTVISQYPNDFVPEPEPEYVPEALESTNSIRFTTDVGTMGDGASGSEPGPFEGLGIMRDVLGGAAGAYGNDVLETAKGLALLTIFPPGYFAWQRYNFWSGIGGAALAGYKQDGVFGAVAGAINVVNPFAHVGISLAATVDAAEKSDYAKAGENGYHAAKALAQIAMAAIGAGIARGGGERGGSSRVTSGSQVTEKVIRDAMKDAPLKSQQVDGVSLPKVQAYVDRLLAGEKPPAIKVDGRMLVDGNHRYIAGRIVGQEPAIQPWAGGRPNSAASWDTMPIDPKAW